MKGRSILLSFILNQLQQNLAALKLRMLHADLDIVARSTGRDTISIASEATHIATRVSLTKRTGQLASIIKTDDIMAGDNLSQPAVHRIAHLDEVVIEQDQEFAIQAGSMRTANKLHHHTARDIAVLVDIHRAFLVRNQKLAVAETEHVQRPEVFDALGNAVEGIVCVWGFGVKVRHGPGLLLVQGEDFDTALGGDGQRGVEHADAVAFGGDVELVVFAEELCLGAAGLDETGLAGG